jgi:signal transduction histidine kinase
VEEIAHAVHEDEAALLPLERKFQTLRHAPQIEAFGLALVLVALVLRTARLLRASENALAHQLARVQEANRDLDAFAGRFAHDFRGLLNPLSLLAGMLRGEGASERTEQVADRLKRLATRAERELEAVLAFARDGRSADRKASATLSHAIEQAVEDLEHAVSAADLQISVDVQDVAVAVPPGLLQAVVLNLLGNAVKFLAGRPRRVVRVRGGRENGCCVLEIEDTGPGIAPEAQARIFEPFYRAPGAPASGTGMGLAIVHRIVQAHDGEVTFRSVVGEGTTFRVVLPLAEGAAGADRR